MLFCRRLYNRNVILTRGEFCDFISFSVDVIPFFCILCKKREENSRTPCAVKSQSGIIGRVAPFWRFCFPSRQPAKPMASTTVNGWKTFWSASIPRQHHRSTLCSLKTGIFNPRWNIPGKPRKRASKRFQRESLISCRSKTKNPSWRIQRQKNTTKNFALLTSGMGVTGDIR